MNAYDCFEQIVKLGIVRQWTFLDFFAASSWLQHEF